MKKAGFAVLVATAVMMTVGWGNAGDDLTYNGQALSKNRTYPHDFANTFVGEPYPDVMGASITIQRQFRRTLPSISSYGQTASSRYRADSGVSGHAFADVADRDARYAGCPTTMCVPDARWVMWDSPFYMRDNKKPADGFLGYSTAVAGFATGLTRMLGDSGAIGLAIGYDARRMTPKGKGYHFRNKADTLHMALYGGTTLGNFSLDAYAGWSRSWNRMEREVLEDGDLFGIFKGSNRDNVYSAGIKASYVWTLPNDTRITPSFGLDFSHVRMDAISDTSSPEWDSGLRSSETGYSNLAMPIMVSVNRTFGSDFLTFNGARSQWTPEVRAGYVPVIGRDHASIDFHSANNLDYFKTKSAKFTGSYGTIGSSLKVKLADKFMFEAAYDFTLGTKYQNHSVTGTFGVSF